jgi:hypothetical protein
MSCLPAGGGDAGPNCAADDGAAGAVFVVTDAGAQQILDATPGHGGSYRLLDSGGTDALPASP